MPATEFSSITKVSAGGKHLLPGRSQLVWPKLRRASARYCLWGTWIQNAKEYVEAMWLMLQQDEAEDFVIATGKTYTVRDFVERAAKYVGFDIAWEGTGVNEIGIDRNTGKKVIEVNPKYFRPTEVDLLIGDATKAKNKLNWEAKVELDELVKIMMEHDIKMVKHTKVFADEKRG
jgi:GDPmannose 4,6-dehydratase